MRQLKNLTLKFLEAYLVTLLKVTPNDQIESDLLQFFEWYSVTLSKTVNVP